MRSFIFGGLGALCAVLAVAGNPQNKKVVCFWNSTSISNPEPGRFTLDHLKSALPHCTHLIYGYAGINPDDNVIAPLPPYMDLYSGSFLWSSTTELKNFFPGLKIYLSVGGNADRKDKKKYLDIIETPKARSSFVESAFEAMKKFGFDGIDLAWQFPIQEKKDEGFFGSVFQGFKEKVGLSLSGEEETVYRQGFTALVQDLKSKFKSHDLDVTVTILPYINTTAFYEPKRLGEIVDAVHLMTFDLRTPYLNPNVADYPAAIDDQYRNGGQLVQLSIDSIVKHWLSNKTPSAKIIVGMPAFGRSWRFTYDSGELGWPPLNANGPGAAGPITRTPGMLSYGEICTRLTENSPRRIKEGKLTDIFGKWGYLRHNGRTGADGFWISFEDPATARNKVAYVKEQHLGGIAIFDLSTEDFHGTCDGKPFPIVRAVKATLQK